MCRITCRMPLVLLLCTVVGAGLLVAEDSPQWGTPGRRNVHDGRGLPTTWTVPPQPRRADRNRPAHQPYVPAGSKNVKWALDIGSQVYCTPTVANGRIFVGTNNAEGFLDRLPPDVDLGVMLCIDEATGKLLWQFSRPKLATGRVNDWPQQGLPSTPCTEGERVWFVTNRCTVVCADTLGFRDGENDGPFDDEPNTLLDEADVVWELDLVETFGVFPHNMTLCSPIQVDGVLFVNTSNGVDETHVKVPNPKAPSFLALDAATGRVLWSDATPGRHVLHGGWAPPSYGVIDGVPQVVFPGGDGWLYAFDPKGDGQGRSKLLWKFDCNPKTSKWTLGGRGTRNSCLGFALIEGNRVHYAVGQDPEHGSGVGHLWCIDATKRGDTSAELVVDAEGRPIDEPNAIRGDIPAGHRVIANENSAAVWHYGGIDTDGSITGKKNEIVFHRTMSTPVIADGLLYAADMFGTVHCLDAATGRRHWVGDTLAEIWGSPVIVGDRVLIGDLDGDVHAWRHSADPDIALPDPGRNRSGVRDFPEGIVMPNCVYSTPVVANGTLFLTDRTTLYAIAEK